MSRFVLAAVLAIALSGTACTALLGKDTSAIAPLALVGSTWMTMTVEGVSVPVDVESTLTFPDESRIAGNGGCNPFSATLEVAANELDIGPISRGRRVCTPEVMATESSYLAALQIVTSFRATELFLYLSDESGRQRISLSRVPPTTSAPPSNAQAP